MGFTERGTANCGRDKKTKLQQKISEEVGEWGRSEFPSALSGGDRAIGEKSARHVQRHGKAAKQFIDLSVGGRGERDGTINKRSVQACGALRSQAFLCQAKQRIVIEM